MHLYFKRSNICKYWQTRSNGENDWLASRERNGRTSATWHHLHSGCPRQQL